MKKIVSYELANGNIQFGGTLSEVNITTECDKVIFYSLKDEDSESFYALNPEIINYKYVYRLILEYCANDMEIILDFSNLDNWADDCIPKALAATENVSKTIVLVEGSSDKDILEFAMSQLYPHLSDLFYFMDFSDESGGKRDGGTSYVIKNLKTLFSKIRANFIAIFDNDAEGYSSKCSLLNEIKTGRQILEYYYIQKLQCFINTQLLHLMGKLCLMTLTRKLLLLNCICQIPL